MNHETHAKLVYDSARVQSSPGSRSAFSAERFLQFETGSLAIDLVSHGCDGQHTRMLHGQVVDSARSTPIRRAAVRSTCVGTATHTDELGQFAVLVPSGDEEPRTLEIETDSGPVLLTVPGCGRRPWTSDRD